MSLYNHPSEHKLRKPRAGFERSKQLLIKELYEYNSIEYRAPLLDLNERSLSRTRREQNWKVWKKLMVVFAISLPIILGVNQFVFQYLAKINQENLNKINSAPLSFFTKLEFGFKAYSNKEYQKAIFYYNSAEKENDSYFNGALGMMHVYREMCENGNINGCELFDEILLIDKVKRHFKNKTKKEIIAELELRKDHLKEIHLGIPNMRKAFNHTLRKAYTALNDNDYSTAIDKFSHIEKHYRFYINGTLGLLSVYDEMCKNKISDGCQLLNEKLFSPNAVEFFKEKSRKEKLNYIRGWKEKKIKLHLKEVTNYDFHTSGY